jgi:hypothetical protein
MNTSNPEMQSKKRESEEFHHRNTNFIPVILFGGFETSYKINTKKSHFNFFS